MFARSLLLLAFTVQLGACTKFDDEPINGRYFIDNRLAVPLAVRALVSQGPPVVMVDTIPANTMEVFMNVVEGPAGHSLPSNFLQTLVITSNGDTVYSGVNNADWQGDDTPTRTDFVLVIE